MPVIMLTPETPFSLNQTLSCGQVFRWDRAGNGWWHGVVEDRAIKIRQDKRRLRYEGADREFIDNYFSLDQDLASIIASFDRDPFIHAAVERCRGLRIIRQPKWECLISYTVATNSNIPTIRRRIAAICEKFGNRIRFEGRTFYSFPGPESISCKGADALSCCKLGYRQPFIFRTACDITDAGAWERKVTSLAFEDARKEVMQRSGIGPKAADCILLFAFGKLEAFPVDVWIRRIMQRHYLPDLNISQSLPKKEYDAVRHFGREYFGEYCGYAQEYLFAARLDE